MKIKHLLLSTILLCLSFMVSATSLGVGELAITSFNSDGNDEFSFVLLANISGTTTVYFTENGWDDDADGGGAAPNWGNISEGTVTWTYVGALPAGTEIQITTPAATVTASHGTVVTSGSWSLSSLRDVIIAYTGTGIPNNGSEVTNFIWAFHEGTNGFVSNASSSLDSGIPTGLTNGSTAIDFADGLKENFQYDCSTLTPVATLRTALATEANFTSSDIITYLAPGCAYLTSPTTTWNGATWDNGAPNTSTDAVIASNTTPGTFTCNNLTINSGFALAISSGNTATISGNVTNNGNGFTGTGVITFDNDGNSLSLSGNAITFEGIINVSGTTTLATNGLITLTASSASAYGQISGTGTITGNVAIEAYLQPGAGGRYYYLGSPMANASLSDFNEAGSTMVSQNSAQGTAWEWDAANAEWDPAGSGNLANTAVRGTGYALYVGMNGAYGPFLRNGDGTISLTGAVDNAATVGVTLDYNDGQASSSDFVTGTTINDTEGWNLVANPYTAIYDWDGQVIPGSMSSAIYRFNGTNYSSYVKGAGTASRYIAPFQAFFVQMTDNVAATLTFDRDNRATGQSASLAKTSGYTVDGITLHIEGMGGNVYDDVFVGFDANSTASFDNEWDARKLRNKGMSPSFYVSMGQYNYSICRVAYTDAWSFPLKLDYTQDGDAMSIQLDASELKSFGQVLLEDRKLNVMHNLKTSDYSFTQSNAFGPDRFILHFAQPSIGMEKPGKQVGIYAFSNEQGLNVELGTLRGATVELFSLSGQLVDRKEAQHGRVHFPVGKRGVYLLRIGASGFVQSLKVIH